MTRRTVAGAVAAVALGIGLAGCASPAPVGLPTVRDVVGTCKDLATADEMVTMSDVSPAVPCSRSHVYETYDVVSVPSSITAFPERPGPEIVQAQTRDACPYDTIRPYLGAGPLDDQWGISIWQKVPTRAEWRHHVRRLVCNIVVDSREPATVPRWTGSLRGIMAYRESARVRLCRTDAPAEYTTCDRPHDRGTDGAGDRGQRPSGPRPSCGPNAARAQPAAAPTPAGGPCPASGSRS